MIHRVDYYSLLSMIIIPGKFAPELIYRFLGNCTADKPRVSSDKSLWCITVISLAIDSRFGALNPLTCIKFVEAILRNVFGGWFAAQTQRASSRVKFDACTRLYVTRALFDSVLPSSLVPSANRNTRVIRALVARKFVVGDNPFPLLSKSHEPQGERTRTRRRARNLA